MEEELIILGKRIADLRLKKGYTQEKLAELINYSTNHISKLELARTNPSFDLLLKLANAFDIELKDLFNFDDYQDINYIREKIADFSKTHDEKLLKTVYKIKQSLSS